MCPWAHHRKTVKKLMISTVQISDLFLYLILVVVVEMVEVAVEMMVVDMEGVNGATILVDSTGCSV